MLRLVRLDEAERFSRTPEPLPFPGVHRHSDRSHMLAGDDIGDLPIDAGACRAAHHVEDALNVVQRKLENLRRLVGAQPQNPDRPRAA